MLVDSHLDRGPAPYWRAVAENIEPNASPWRVGLGRLLMGSQKSRFNGRHDKELTGCWFQPPFKKHMLIKLDLVPPKLWEDNKTPLKPLKPAPIPTSQIQFLLLRKKHVTGRSPATCYWTSSELPEDAVLKHDRCDTSLISMPQPVVLNRELQN